MRWIGHAVDALNKACENSGKPEIINTDQSSEFTAHAFVDAVLDRGVKLSMDGRGVWRDNVFVEYLWRSVKYEWVCLCAYDSVGAARKDIAEYIAWYNYERPHSSLDVQTPIRVWHESSIPLKVAA
jgi:putative transposase